MSIPRDEMAKAVMAELARQHPELTVPQLLHAMAKASWDLESHPVKVSIPLPLDEDDLTVEIEHAPADDLRRELGGS